MIFGSTTLFVFSIAVAFLNPFFISVDLTTYQSLIYTILISGGALATGRYLIVSRRQESLGHTVIHIAFW